MAKILPVDVPMRLLPIAIVTLKGRGISPALRLFMECARKIVEPIVLGIITCVRWLMLWLPNPMLGRGRRRIDRDRFGG
jgi:hypothetical protein